MANKTKSLRSMMLELEVHESFKIAGVRFENTLRNYAATLGPLTGRKFSVMKQGDVSISVFRYE